MGGDASGESQVEAASQADAAASGGGGRRTIVYNDLVKAGDRGLSAAARAKYEASLKADVGKALGVDLSGATVMRASSLGVLRDDLVLVGDDADVIVYMHVVGPDSARALSPTGSVNASASAQDITGWLPSSTRSVTIVGCRADNLASSLSAAMGGTPVSGTSATVNVFDWVNSRNPSDVRMWESTRSTWTGAIPGGISPFQMNSYPELY